MKPVLSLRKPPSTETVPAAPATAGSVPGARPPVSRLAAWTRPSVVAPWLLLCAGMLVWSLCFRLPHVSRPLPVFAREADVAAQRRLPVVTGTALEVQRRTAEASGSTLVSGREEFKELLVGIEDEARRLGWQIEFTVQPPIVAARGFKELTIFPVLAQLEVSNPAPTDAYPALLAWLGTISALPKRAEVVHLALVAGATGLTSARAEIHFLSRTAHAKVAAQ